MSSRRRIVSVAATLLVTLAMHSANLAAQALNTAQVGVSPNFSGGTGPFAQNITAPGHLFIAGTATGGPVGTIAQSGSGDGSVDVDYGQVKLFADAFGSLNTVSRGIFRDALTFTSLGLPTGTIATVTYKVGMQGLLTINPPPGIGQAGWQLQADLGGGAFDISKSGQLSNAFGSVVYTGDALGTFVGIGTVQLGFAAPLDAEFTISAQAAFDFVGPGSATANFLHTGFWDGIQSVTVGGVAVAYSVTSVSGTDWTQSFATVAATPEPATWALLGTGLLALCAVRRRTRA